MSKVLIIYLSSLLVSFAFVGNFLSQQEQIAYNKCLTKHNSNNYCKVLVWGR